MMPDAEGRLARIETDIREIKTAIQDLSVQRENLGNMAAGVKGIHEDLKAITSRLGDLRAEQEVRRLQSDANKSGVEELFTRIHRLQSDHDSCQIQRVAADMAWVKWLVMSHTAAITGMLLGLVAQYLRSGATP